MATLTKESAQRKRRKRWLSLIIGLFLVGVLVLPEVNSSIAQYQALGALRAQRAGQADWPERARLLRARVQQVREETVDLENTLVPADEVSKFTEGIGRLARVDCQLRSIRPGPVSLQSLDELLGGASSPTAPRKATPVWMVRSQVSLVSIQGSFENLVAFISMLDDEARILQLDLLDLRPLRPGAEELILDLQLKTFNLSRGDPA